MRIQHRSFDVLVSEQFLYRADIIAIGQQVRGKWVAKDMTGGMLYKPCLPDRVLDHPLDGGGNSPKALQRQVVEFAEDLANVLTKGNN